MKKFLYGLVGLFVVAVAVLLVGPGLWDWNGYKPEILARIKAETGRDMAIDGDLSLAVLPSPRLAVDGVRVANIAGATAPEFARFESLRVRVRLMPLLSGRIEVESVELVNPVIELERLADGRVNWEIGPQAGKAGSETSEGAPGASRSTGAAGPSGGSFSLDRLLIRGGRLVYRDAAAGSVERIENLNVEASAGSLAGPFGLTGALTLRGVPLDVTAMVGRLDGDRPAPFELRLAHAGAGAKAAISGTLDPAKLALRGRIKISGSDLGGLARAAAAGKAALPPWLGQEFALEAKLAASPEGASIDDIDLRIGNVTASGAINAVIGERTRIDTTLRLKRIDLDKWLAMTSPPAGGASSGSAGESAAPPSQPAADSTPGTGDGFALPDGIDLSLDVAIDAVSFKRRRMSEIRLIAALDKGAVKLSRLSARLPGGGTASLTGSLSAAGGKAKYRGETRIRADNLRAILDWLGVDAADVPADRLRKFQLDAKFDGNQEQVQISDLVIRLDASRIRGGITYALRARPAFGARINVDHFNVDAYLPRAPAGAAGSAETGKPADGAPAGTGAAAGAGATAPDQPAPASPLAVLDAFDANLVVRVGTLNYRRTPIQGLAFDGSLVGGILTIRKAEIRDISGTTARISGTLDGFAGVPVFKGSFSASSKDVTGLFRIAGIVSPVAPRLLGRLKLTGKADGGADRVKLDTTLELAGAKIVLDGEMTGLATTPRFELDLSARHPDAARLARLFGAEIGARGKPLGAFVLAAKAKGRLDAVKLETTLELAGAKIVLDGEMTGLGTTPKLELDLSARHPDIAKLARLFGAEIGARGKPLGAFDLAAKATGRLDAVDLAARLAAVGAEVTFAGKITQAMTRPAVTGTIDARHPDFVQLARIFSPAYRPARPATGPFRLSTRISATETAARLDDIAGRLGATSFGGAVEIKFAGPKPVVTAKLTAGDIDLNSLLPGAAKTARQAPASPAAAAGPVVPTQGRPGARRYSREPIDLSVLGAYDGTVELSANSVTWRTFRVDTPRLAAGLRDSVLTVSELAGKMFDGAFGLEGVLDARRVPKLDGTVKIVRANVGKALFEAANFDIADGTLDFDIKLAAVGNSQHAMVSSLNGRGRLAVRNGTVKGFDLQAVSDRLKNLDRTLDFLSLFRAAMGGGTTRFTSLDGTMRILKGVIRTDDLTLVANAGRGEVKGFVDLPRWNMDMRALFRLTQHSNAPPFRVRLTGPPDQADQKVDFAALQQFLVGRIVQRGAGRLLNKFLPGLVPPSRSQPPTQAAPSQQPEQPAPREIKPRDFIRGLLKGLGR